MFDKYFSKHCKNALRMRSPKVTILFLAKVLIKQLTKRFGKVVAADKVDLEVRDKELLYFWGLQATERQQFSSALPDWRHKTKERYTLETALSMDWNQKKETSPWFSRLTHFTLT
jgi:hypothetical protein